MLVHSVSESPACTIPDVPTNVLPFEYENGVDESPTSSTLNKIPEGVDGKSFTKHLLNNFGVEIGGGLGDLAGKVWRIGLMGYNSTSENVDKIINIFETELPKFR